jgi:uncharacterized protein
MIKIFKSNKALDLESLIDTRMLIQANSGGGKSYALRKILEETHGKILSIIFDVEGEFKTLREKYDFLLIGEKDKSDVPVSLQAAPLLPQKILELEIPTIIDISELKMHERILYVKKFLQALMQLPAKYWKPCLVVLDEAHLLCGQQEKQDSFREVIDLMTRGRKRGFCGILLTQRIAKLHKDAAAEANNVLIGRTGLDIDMKRASEILGFTSKEQLLSLRNLEPGEFFTYGPALSRGVEREFIGEVKTTHPRRGQGLTSGISKPTERVKEILVKLSDLPNETRDEENAIQKLRGKIQELNIELRKRWSNVPDPRMQENLVNLQNTVKSLEKDNRDLKNLYKNVCDRLKQIGRLVPESFEEPVSAKVETFKPVLRNNPMPVRREAPSIQKTYDSQSSGNLGKCERLIYSFLYHNNHRTFTTSQIGAMTGYSHKSGSFSNALSRLRSLDLIQGSNNGLQIKSAVEEHLVDGSNFEPDNIFNLLGKCEKEIALVLKENPDAEFTKEELADMTPSKYSSNSGSFSNSLSKLATLDYLERVNGKIRLHTKAAELYNF